ncbi:MAG: DUF2141 domain-containing protein [Niveispirillum sp.]|uniref:DUF2141 domain-containing protein n=1 Tax=Niveispirillum sp. TaxID=1917217 RepID=UPI003BA7A753
MYPILPVGLFIGGLLFALPAASAQTTPGDTADLTVHVTGMKSADGEVGCALHSLAESFPMGQEQVQPQWLPPGQDGTICRFTGLAPGRYAVAVSHDRNGNRRTDTGLFGIPTEAWGVSNNVRPGLRPPRFDEAAIDLAVGEHRTISVEVAK